MKIITHVCSIILLCFMIGLISSCEENDSGSEQDSLIDKDPVPLQEFYFQGTLGDEDFLFKAVQYDASVLNVPLNDYSFEFGGSRIDKEMASVNLKPVEFCYGSYAFGIGPNPGITSNIPHGKIYLRNIFLDQCFLENEILNLKSTFKNDDFVYSQSLGDKSRNRVEFFYYPTGNLEDDFYSSINENANSSFVIDSVIKEEEGTFILEGRFECRMYSLLDDANFKDLKDGKFRIRVKTNL